MKKLNTWDAICFVIWSTSIAAEAAKKVWDTVIWSGKELHYNRESSESEIAAIIKPAIEKARSLGIDEMTRAGIAAIQESEHLADTKRLDWLDTPTGQQWVRPELTEGASNIREAIDAAMKPN